MAFSTQRAVSDGTMSYLDLTINYISRDDIQVFYDGLPADPDTWDWVGTTETRISFTPNVPNGVEVLIARTTRINGIINVFALGAKFNNTTMDENFTQLLYLNQEAVEGAALTDIFNDVDMHGKHMKNLGLAVDRNDAITYGQVQDMVPGVVTSANAAAASAAAAAASESNAAASAATASAAAASTAGSVAAAAASASAASGSASASAGSASSSAASASSAAASATNAANAYDSFDDRWLGPKSADPTLDNDGNPLLEGAAYWNTPGALLKVWSVAGSIWTAINSFVQAGAGAITRTWQAKAREIVSITDFGAVGDDATDNLAAFNAVAAYIAASARGVKVYVPAGVYRLSASPTFSNTKSFILQGEGDASKIRLVSGGGGPTLVVGASTSASTRQVIKDLFFQGPVSGTSSGLRLWNANTARVEGCVFQSQVNGVILDASYAVEITSNVFDVCSTYAIVSETTSCHNLIVEKNNFFSAGVGGGGQAIRLSVASDNIVIENNDFEQCNVAVRLNSCTAVSISKNYIEYCANSAFDFLGTCRNVAITRNWLAFGSATATISNVTGGEFSANTVLDQTVTTSACTDFTIGMNYKSGTGTLGQSTWATPVLSGTFSQQANFYTAQYIKGVSNNRVKLRGNLLNGANGSVIFTLPVGYRPSAILTFATASSAAPGLSVVEVRTNGDVWCVVRDGGGGTGLNGIEFEATN